MWETSGHRALCAWEWCHCEATSCVPAKGLIISFALLLIHAVKQSGRILDSLLDPPIFLKNCQCTLPWNQVALFTQCDRSEWKTATRSSLLFKPNDHVTITMLKSGVCMCVWTYWTAFLFGFYVLQPQSQNTNAVLVKHLLRFPAAEI